MEPYGRIAAVAPPAALLVAFLGRLFLPGITHVYSESFLFLAFAVAGGIISGPVGAMTLFGYVLGDVLGGGLLQDLATPRSLEA